MATPVGFPKELSNEISYSLPPSVSSYSLKVIPSNLSQVASAQQTLASTTAQQLNGTSTNIIFDIPCGQSKSQFLDPRFSMLNFRVKYSITNTPAAMTISNCQLRSHAAAFFDRMFMQSNGQVIDDITAYNVVNDMLVQNEISVAERDSLAALYGFQYENVGTGSINANQGHVIQGINNTTPAAQVDRYYSYSIPLLNSLIGKGADKFFNHGSLSNLQLVLQTSSIIPLTIVTTNAGTTPIIMQVTIDNISLNLQVVDVGLEGLKMLGKAGPQYFSGITYRTSTQTLPAATAGQVSLLTGVRGASVRSLFFRATEASTLSTTGCINFVFDSKMPVSTATSWNINGTQYPSNPVDFVRNPAKALADTQQAIGNFNTYEFKSGLVPSQYFITIPSGSALPNDADAVLAIATSASSVANQAQFCYGLSLEKVAKHGILDGMDLRSGNTFLNMQLAVANSNSVTLYFIARMDIVYVLDTASGTLSVRM
jgi:hypothetical protein